MDCSQTIDDYLKRLFPIARSITGDGNRETLGILKELIPLKMVEYPTGQEVYDWTVPREWRIHDAWIKDGRGRKIVDFAASNLHVVGYSVPVRQRMQLDALKAHLHYLPRQPAAIPYRTSYYQEDWGFCLSFETYEKYFREDETYEVCIDSELINGSLTIGEMVIPGQTETEILISTYICHPSMANDNLSGVVMTALLARELTKQRRHFSYRIVFVPETIGAIAYCANNEAVMKKIDTGFVVTTVGGDGAVGYKSSIDEGHPINRIIEQTLRQHCTDYLSYPFLPLGSDERQYSSPGFRINVASITKDKYYDYPYYHTSLDNLDFVKAEHINESLNLYLHAIEKLEKNQVYRNCFPHGEINLKKYGLHEPVGGIRNVSGDALSSADLLLVLLMYCDGHHSLLDISEKSHVPIERLFDAAEILAGKKILERVGRCFQTP